MRWTRVTVVGLAALVLGGTAWAFVEATGSGKDLTTAAAALVSTMNDAQRRAAVLPYDAPVRVDWHFIPKSERKGLQLKEMSKPQQDAARHVLHAALSEVGYDKATKIMSLERLLRELEAGQGANIRDPERYFFTIFGNPGPGRWGLSIEGHHLSLNFVVEGERVISSTPQVFGANPATVMDANSAGVPMGLRVLEQEEALAFDLVNGLTAEQQSVAVLSSEPMKEVRNAGAPQPPDEPPAGIAYSNLNATQQSALKQLISVYCDAMLEDVAGDRITDISKAGWDRVHFAWLGATEPGIGHSYRIQGPTFVVEFVNVQPDAAGHVANHIHAIWRDFRGDFALPREKK